MPSAVVMPSGRPERRAQVVVAEDDTELRHMLAALLCADGYEVVEVINGEELLEYIESIRHQHGPSAEPALIISDVCMPALDGLEVLKQLRRARVGTPVVLMTAFANPSVVEQADQLGAVTLLSKPFEIDDLRMIVLNVAHSHNDTAKAAG
jgi:CheY-like chemotaxis protein